MSTFGDTLDVLTTEYEANQEHYSRDDLVRLLVDIRELRAGLATLAGDVTKDLLAHADEKRFVVPDIGEVEIKKSTKRTQWRHDEMLPAVIARVMDEKETLYDRDTGELLPYVQIGHNLTSRLRECVSLGGGKVTGLRAIGLQPDEFCKEEADGWDVKLPPRKTDG